MPRPDVRRAVVLQGLANGGPSVGQVHGAILLHVPLKEDSLLASIQVLVPADGAIAQQRRVEDAHVADRPPRVVPTLLHASQAADDFEGEADPVKVYINYLRRKLNGPGDADLIQALRGFGYVLKEAV